MTSHSFWTQSYKGHWIHGKVENGQDVIQWMPEDTRVCYRVKSIRAAKAAITKYVGSKS